ncbi:hypothetical protein CkaCkLH20_12615 [Colletotrichum karsti]|uniref:Uncharacterized protein n=1 Tax=Colletotrichum karsti TaxID=1095194 RepID=A0A9P6LE28_9PEZI|nr:uncharacterized protein CkaCkLH20_12615 [Colletotrichum karsti]KAF9869908.1 hypothetical protein CkaCkLH20_12615 [Colletotrichum karsti]
MKTTSMLSRRRSTGKTYIIVAIALTIFLRVLHLYFFSSTDNPKHLPASSDHMNTIYQEEINQEVDNICSALDSLYNLYGRRPTSFQDPFTFLKLDPRAPPFHPPELSAHPGAANHAEAHRAVTLAIARMRNSVWARHASGDPRAAVVLDVTFDIAHALEDDATRIRYLVDVEPKFSKMARYPDGKWRVANEFCGEFWRRVGWR